MSKICRMNARLVTSLVRVRDPEKLGGPTQSQIWFSETLFTVVKECENRGICHKVGLTTLAVSKSYQEAMLVGAMSPYFLWMCKIQGLTSEKVLEDRETLKIQRSQHKE